MSDADERATEERFAFLMADAVQGFTAHCGFESVSMQPGRFTARIELAAHHRQQDGFVHAGVLTTLADHAAGYAAYSVVPPDRRILTIELKINFLAPAVGRIVECRARVLKPGRRVLVTEAEVFAVGDQGETLVAKALATMAAVSAETWIEKKTR